MRSPQTRRFNPLDAGCRVALACLLALAVVPPAAFADPDANGNLIGGTGNTPPGNASDNLIVGQSNTLGNDSDGNVVGGASNVVNDSDNNAVSGIGNHVGSRAYFAEAPDPMPMVPLYRMLGSIPAPVWAMLSCGLR